MKEKKINCQLTKDIKKQALKEINDLYKKLESGFVLTPRERRNIHSVGKARTEIVKKALRIARNNPDVISKSFDIKKFLDDYRQMRDFEVLVKETDRLCNLIFACQLVKSNEVLEKSKIILKLAEIMENLV